ncbi:MAG: antibiotic biosynthesis monooxygenase [Firmicutes bacterium]|nr:antibiotic biosynthesis monooxygenase [Bacillota bacterium]
MLKIVAKSKIKEGMLDQYLAAVKPLVLGSQAEEGNVSYTMNILRGSENVVAFIEVWKDQAAFEYHIKTEHFTTILPTLKDFVEEGFPAEFYEEVEF